MYRQYCQVPFTHDQVKSEKRITTKMTLEPGIKLINLEENSCRWTEIWKRKFTELYSGLIMFQRVTRVYSSCTSTATFPKPLHKYTSPTPWRLDHFSRRPLFHTFLKNHIPTSSTTLITTKFRLRHYLYFAHKSLSLTFSKTVMPSTFGTSTSIPYTLVCTLVILSRSREP